MSALHSSRRELLGTGLVAAGIGLTGCADDPTAGSDTEDSTERVSDLETASLRGPVDAPLARLPTASDDADENEDADPGSRDATTDGNTDADTDGGGGGNQDGDSDSDPDSEPDLQPFLLLTESADVDDLEYARDREGSDDVRSLLAGTNFDDESVFVYQDRIGECYERRLEYAERAAEEVSLEFCRVERDASVACSLERKQLQATFVRVPFAYDVEPTGRSVGVSSSCRPTPPGDGDGRENGTADAEGDE